MSKLIDRTATTNDGTIGGKSPMSIEPNEIVSKQQASPALNKIAVTQFVKPRHGEKMRFEVNLVAESLDGMKKKAVVEPNLPTWGSF